MATFEKRHFKFMAEMLKDIKPIGEKELRQWQIMTAKIANRLRQTNPYFDEYKFLAACEWSDWDKPEQPK